MKAYIKAVKGGSLFDIQNSHTLGEIAFKSLVNSGAYLTKQGLSKAVKSDFAKNKIKNVANKYLDKALDSFTSDLSKKISGNGIDIHKTILKVAPKKGFTLITRSSLHGSK